MASGARLIDVRTPPLMVGKRAGTSLGMAPAFVVAQLCDFVNIDGPLLLKYDHPMGLNCRKGVVDVFSPRR